MARVKHRNNRLIHTANGRRATGCTTCADCSDHAQAAPSAYSVVLSGVTICPAVTGGTVNGTWVVPRVANASYPTRCLYCLTTSTAFKGGVERYVQIMVLPYGNSTQAFVIVQLVGFPPATLACDPVFTLPGSIHFFFNLWTFGAAKPCEDAWPTIANGYSVCDLSGSIQIVGTGGTADVTPL